MKVDIGIHLFFEAEMEMDGVDVSRKGIREYVKGKGGFLRDVADLAGVLQRDGWSLKVVRNNLVGTHPEVKSAEEATARLLALGILDDLIDVGEWDERGKRLNA
jgi:hypothetical protein